MKFGARTFGAAFVCLWISNAAQAQQAAPPKLGEDLETIYTSASASKRAEAKKYLAELIKTTPGTHPDMPELLFRYGEVCFEDARAQLRLLVELEDQIFAAQQKKDAASVAKLNKQREAALKLAKDNRLEAFTSYKKVADEYTTYAKRDQVLFHMGYNLKELSQEIFLESERARDASNITLADELKSKSESYNGKGLEYYKLIIKEYPASVFVPDALFALGQDYFDQNDLAAAQKVFDKIVKEYPETKAYGYALYLLGWCEYNNQNFPESIKRWVEVINYSRKTKGTSLEQEATRDIPRAYAQYGEAKKAKSFFQKIAGADSYQPMLKRLGELYKEQGQFKSAIAVYQDLISLDLKSDGNYLYQYEISKATLALTAEGTARSEVVAQLQALSKMYQDMQARRADAAKIADAKELTSQFLQEIATSWDAECFKTRAPKCMDSVKPLYEQYLKSFPEAKDTYTMSWNYAELTYRMAEVESKYWEDAGLAYLSVLESDSKGEHTQEAIIAMAEAFKRASDQSKFVRSKGALSEREQRALQGFTLGAQLDPNGKAASYLIASSGYLYWLHSMDKEAVPYLQQLVDGRPADPLTADANKYLLLSLSALNEDSTLLSYAEKTSYFDAEMTAAVLPVYFSRCQQQYDASQSSAGDCFARLPEKFPLMSEASKGNALYNAAQGYERSKQVGLAIQLRNQLITEHPAHEKAQASMYALGVLYSGIGSYTKAAETLEQFAAKYPNATEATIALNDAAIYREGLGEYDKAKEDNKKFLALANKKNETPASIAETSFRALKLVERAGDNKKTAVAYEEYLKTYAADGTLDNQLAAKTWLAANAFKANKKEEAYSRCEQVMKEVSELKEEQREALSGGLDAAAECQFYLAEKGYATFEALKPPSTFERSTFSAWFTEAKLTREETSASYLKVTQYNSKQWSLAALARIGVMSYNFAKRLEKLPAPVKALINGREVKLSSLSKADQEAILDAYTQTLEELISPLYQDARASMEICIEASTKTSFFNEWSSTCEEYLNKMDPSVYPIASEWQASTTQEFSSVIPVSLVTKLK